MALTVVRAWVQAFERRDTDRLLALTYLDARRALVRALQDGPYTATVVEPIAP